MMKKWIAILALCALGICGAMQEGALALSRDGGEMRQTPRMADAAQAPSSADVAPGPASPRRP